MYLISAKGYKNAKMIKSGGKIGTAYCLGWKDYTDNFKPQEIKVTNKKLRKKSNCVVCRSSKSTFLKQKQQQKIILGTT